MTDISALEAYAGQLSSAAALATAAAQTQSEIVNGDALTDVLTESGSVPTLAKQAVQAQDKVTAALMDLASQMAGAMTYGTTAQGLAGTLNGGYFSVPSADTDEYLILYKNNSGSSLEVSRYPSAGSVQAIKNTLPHVAPIGYAWTALDKYFRAAIGVKDDGTFAAKLAEIAELRVALVKASELRVAEHSLVDGVYPGFKWVLTDVLKHAAVGVMDDGTLVSKVANISDLKVGTLNGLPFVSGAMSRLGGVYSHQLNFINNSGQSLGEGSAPATALTTAQEYDNFGFPARSTDPAALVPLTVANTQVGTRGESPMYGTLGHIKELIKEENGIAYGANDYQLTTCNNAYGATSILGLNKGSIPYTRAISQVQAAFNIAKAAGKTMAFQATTWTQGESDTGMSKNVYKGHLKQLAADYNADGRAITGQYNDVKLISYQCATANRNIALAQLEASNESALIFMACPMYQFDYGDSEHINAESSKWLGGYYGLAYKRLIVDRQDWQPLQPTGHALNGNTLDLIFNKNGLVLDTTLIPAQVDHGFQVLNAASGAIAITAISVISPNRLRLTLATAPAPGWFVRYGFNSAVNKGPFVGGCGNLRDSQGDNMVYSAINKPMHNWCVIFNYSL